VLGLLLIVACDTPEPAPEALVPAPAIALIDQGGDPFGDAQLLGRPWVANVIFTRCPTICPASTGRMIGLEARTRDLGDAVAFLSFSVDPAYDTPEVLTAYAASLGVDTSRWHFLTGDEAVVRATVSDGLKIAVQAGGGDPAETLHGTHFVLGASGFLHGFYDTEDGERLADLERDLRALVAADRVAD